MPQTSLSADRLPHLLEVTLRDGSYLIDFHFTSSDTAILCSELERVGFSMIEVGHGIGLGAYRQAQWRAAESDEGHMRAAQESLKEAAWGMFCIPGIATLDDVDLAARHGMSFIRIGTNVDRIADSRIFIERAKAHGMLVCANFMKSYALPPREFAANAARSVEYGADVIYVVDSAGGMLPDEIDRVILETRERTSVPLGFHGHDNLNLAVANSLRAFQMGVQIIDTSLQGMGRSAGNTATEVFLAVLERLGVNTGIDLMKVLDLGEHYVRPLLRRLGCSSIDVVTGLGQFHSSYMALIEEFSALYRVDPRQLILEVCRRDKINVSRSLVEEAARALVQAGAEQPHSRRGLFTARFGFDQYHGNEQSELSTQVAR